jgi:hypothetical protein
MNGNIPGMTEVEGREFFYIESLPGEGFNQIIDEALNGSPHVPMPKAGGVIEEKVYIVLDGGRSLLGISYKGDLAGWRAKLLAYCVVKHRKCGIASHRILSLSDGTELALGDCEVCVYR